MSHVKTYHHHTRSTVAFEETESQSALIEATHSSFSLTDAAITSSSNGVASEPCVCIYAARSADSDGLMRTNLEYFRHFLDSMDDICLADADDGECVITKAHQYPNFYDIISSYRRSMNMNDSAAGFSSTRPPGTTCDCAAWKDR